MPANRNAEPKLMVYSGRAYLVRTFAAEGYQGWQGQVMMAGQRGALGSRPERIGLLTQHHGGEGKRVVWVFDLHTLLFGTRAMIDRRSQIVLMQHEGQEIGLLVDALHAVPEFQPAQIISTPFSTAGASALVKQVIQANEGCLMIQAVDTRQLFACVRDATLLQRMNPEEVRRLLEQHEGDQTLPTAA